MTRQRWKLLVTRALESPWAFNQRLGSLCEQISCRPSACKSQAVARSTTGRILSEIWRPLEGGAHQMRDPAGIYETTFGGWLFMVFFYPFFRCAVLLFAFELRACTPFNDARLDLPSSNFDHSPKLRHGIRDIGRGSRSTDVQHYTCVNRNSGGGLSKGTGLRIINRYHARY